MPPLGRYSRFHPPRPPVSRTKRDFIKYSRKADSLVGRRRFWISEFGHSEIELFYLVRDPFFGIVLEGQPFLAQPAMELVPFTGRRKISGHDL